MLRMNWNVFRDVLFSDTLFLLCDSGCVSRYIYEYVYIPQFQYNIQKKGAKLIC